MVIGESATNRTPVAGVGSRCFATKLHSHGLVPARGIDPRSPPPQGGVLASELRRRELVPMAGHEPTTFAV